MSWAWACCLPPPRKVEGSHYQRVSLRVVAAPPSPWACRPGCSWVPGWWSQQVTLHENGSLHGQTTSVPSMLSFIDDLLRVQAQGATFFLQKFHSSVILLWGNVSILSHDICRQIGDHDPAHTIHCLWLSLPWRFQAQYSFPSYLLVPASEWSGDRLVHSY